MSRYVHKPKIISFTIKKEAKKPQNIHIHEAGIRQFWLIKMAYQTYQNSCWLILIADN